MPELPEVETTRRGIEPHVCQQIITDVKVRQRQLRWPIPAGLERKLQGQKITRIDRRAKYLLFGIGESHLLIHLGMSGSLRLVDVKAAAGKHDHVDITLSDGRLLRYNDPRRFGAILWVDGDPKEYELLAQLGPEPLLNAFNGDYLYRLARGRKLAVKNFIMDSRIVVGVGNIYANEALFLAGIHPGRAAGAISLARYRKLAGIIQQVLEVAILQGGTTLRDFVGGDGKPGYFQQSLQVYGRGGESCTVCGRPLSESRIGQRSSVFCPVCQT